MNLLQKFASGLAVLVACSAAQGATLLEQARLDFDRYIDFDNRFYVAANFSVVAEAGTDPGAVPEPGTIALLGLGLAGFAAAGRKRAR